MLAMPLSKRAFLEEIYGSKFLYVKGALQCPPGLNEADTFLNQSEPTAPFIRVFKDGLVPDEQYVERHEDAGLVRRRLSKDRLYAHLDAGATVVLNRLDIRSEAIRALCREVARFTEETATANGYLAISGSGSFGHHWDTHDVFAIQLAGRKRWRIYEPTFPSPLPSQPSLNHKADCPADPIFDEILESGDLLYVPRGYWHRADPIGELTFHIAIGTHGARVIDYLSWACARFLSERLPARESARTDRREPPSAAIELLAELQAKVGLASSWEEFRKVVQSQQRSDLPFKLEEYYPSRRSINLDTPLRVNSHYSFPHSVNGYHITADPAGAALIKTIQAFEWISPAMLLERHREMDEDSALSILDELVRREILEAAR